MAAEQTSFLSFIDSSPLPLLSDGAMATMLHARGIGFHQSFDELNLTHPDLIEGVHEEYIRAGAQVVLTNTFGANRYKLAEHSLEDQLEAINRTGVEIARRAAVRAGLAVWIAGDVGPLGVRLAPFGRVQADQAQRVFEEQIRTLVEAGIDLILIETISDLVEITAAVTAAKSLSGLPVAATVTFTRDDRTLLGDDPAKTARRLNDAGADLIGVNCSGGPAQILRILERMRQELPEARFSVKPNAGFPEQIGGRIRYPAGPAYFSEYALAFKRAGARLIGGCCGTTPEHIASMRAALDSGRTVPAFHLEFTAAPPPVRSAGAPDKPTNLARMLAEGRFVTAVEMQPPRGLSTHKLLSGAGVLAEAGATVINVADSPMARMRMSPWAVCNLIQNQIRCETTLHFPTRGRNLLRVQGDLLATHAMGVRNLFVVMGDPTSIGDYPDAMDDYDLVPSGLIRLIKHGFNAGVDLAGTDIGEPTSFFVGSALNLNPTEPDREIRGLQRKIEAGADFFITQATYAPEDAEAFLERGADKLGPLGIPLLLGVLPLNNPRHAIFLHNEVPGLNIPDRVIERLEAAGSDAPREGIRLAAEMVKQLRGIAAGAYIIPAFGRYDLAAELIERIRD